MGFLSGLSPSVWIIIALSATIGLMAVDSSFKKTQLANAKQEFAEYRLTQESAAKEAERNFKEKLETQITAVAIIEEKYDEDLTAANTKLNAALKRLRHAEASASRRQPAQAAPAECKAYEAPASQLSLADREFLIRIGAEADALAAQVISLQEYINKVILDK